MKNKQLFEKQANSYNPVFPIVRLEDIIETISDKSIQWILSNYNHLYVEYSESKAITRNKVPALLRRKGLWITYNIGNENITEYFKGDNKDVNNYVDWTHDNNWERFDKLNFVDGSITYQHLSEAVKQLLGNGNTITNYPDDEDLTVKDGTLKLKDRDYDVANFSGLGRIILRKNITVVDKELKNVLTQDMIDKENTIYEIRYDFDLNGGEITVPEGCTLKFEGGQIANGVVYSNRTKIINIPSNFNIMGNIYNGDGLEITIKGDIINRKTKVIAPACVYTSEWWKSDFGEDRFMKIARDIGITDFYTLVRIDNTTLPNFQCQPYTEFAGAETVANRFLSNGYKEIFGIKFHTEGGFNDTESAENIMPKLISYITSYVQTLLDSGLIFHNVNIVNEQSNWTNKGSEYIDYVIELADKITDMGLTPRISFDSIYSLKRADARLYEHVSPDFNFYPTIGYLDKETKYSKDISNELIERYNNIYNISWGKPISSFGISETGITAYEKAFRYPWEYRTENLGDYMAEAPVIYWEIISDFINALNNPFVNVWFFEGLIKDREVDIDKMYNIFVKKIK